MNRTTRTDRPRLGRATALAALVLAVALSGTLHGGCTMRARIPDLTVFPPPYLPIVPARKTIVPSSQFMKVAVFNCADQTGRAPAQGMMVADMIATELQDSGRFELYDRGQLRHRDFTHALAGAVQISPADKDRPSVENALLGAYPAHLEALRKDFEAIRADADALFFCSVTGAGSGDVGVDYRLVNAQSYTVMLAGSTSLSVEQTATRFAVSRSLVERVAEEIRGRLPRPDTGKLGKVVVQDGRILTISLGRKDGIIPGLNVFVIAPGRVRGTGPGSVVDEMYLAQAWVLSVYDNTSQVVVFAGDDYRVGDEVRFK